MLNLIWSFASGYMTEILTGLRAVALFFVGRSGGKKSAENKIMKDANERERRGRNAIAKEQAETSGSDNRDIVDRLRGRDGDWGGV